MNISDIIAESTENTPSDKDLLNQYIAAGGKKKLIPLINKYMGQGWSFHVAKEKARDELEDIESRRTASTKDKQQDKKSADKLTKPEKTSRISKFSTAGSDAVSQGTGFISKAWQRGGRWSSALGIPKPKRD